MMMKLKSDRRLDDRTASAFVVVGGTVANDVLHFTLGELLLGSPTSEVQLLRVDTTTHSAAFVTTVVIAY